MKHKGNTDYYIEERNRDLMRAYREQLASSSVVVPTEIYQKIALMPSSRFWVSEWRCAIVLARMFAGDKLESMNPTRREMYLEIFNRAKALRSQDPTLTIFDLAFNVIQQPAPRFYLTPMSICVIITRIRRSMRKRPARRVK